MVINKHTYLLIFLTLLSFAVGSCSFDNKGIDPDEIADNSTSISGGDTYFPNGSGSTDVCETDENGDCDESTENTAAVSLSTQSINFDIGELNEIDCTAITIPGGLSYSAELDISGTENDIDEFAFLTGTNSYSQSRVDGSGDVTICYLRTAKGTHKAQVKIVLGAGSASSAYAYIISVTGQTLDSLFTITSPTSGQIIDVNNNEGIDNTEGDYLITARGSVNLSLLSILESGANTNIIIDADGVKYKTGFDNSGNFEKVIGLPQTQGVYTVSFSLETTKGSTLTKTISVVVAGVPSLEIELRDSSGEKVSTTAPTDAPNLIVGLKVSNLASSGSNPDEMLVTLSDIKINGDKLADDVTIAYDNTNWCLDEDEQERDGFDGTVTYCISLQDITVVQSGVNTISAKASNVLGETTDTFELILDYNKPIITITQPKQNVLKKPGITEITIKGTIKNFAPPTVSVDSNDYNNIPAVQDGDIGSYCQPTSLTDTSCPESSIKLWFNVSSHDDNTPIYIYPEYSSSYDLDQTIDENNDGIEDDVAVTGNCSTTSSAKTLFEGDADNTTVDEDGTIVTTITDEDDGTTTVYTTDTDGNVTVTDSDGTLDEVQIADEDNVTNTISVDSDSGDITSEVDNSSSDIKITTTTDASTGEITQTTDQRVCNIPKGTFKIVLDLTSDDHHAALNLYTNVIEFQAISNSGHRTIKVVTFQTGYVSEHTFTSRGSNTSTGILASGTLGHIDDSCAVLEDTCVDRAPVMIYLSEGVLNKNTNQGRKIIRVLEQLLNDNFKFEDFSNGWSFWPKDDDDNIDIEADFQRQYKEENGNRGYDNFDDLSMDWKEKFIKQGLHSNVMAIKMWALARYVDTLEDVRNVNCDDRPDLCFFEREGDPEDEFNVAEDFCGKTITTAFVPIGDIRHVGKAFGKTDEELNEIHLKLPEWTDVAGSNIEFNDFYSGKWIINSIDLKASGFIDADICLVPDDKDDPELTSQYELYGCDADVSNAKTPAFWGHFAAYNLVYGGLLGAVLPGGMQVDDDTMPLIWSVGKLRIKLTDVIQLKVDKIDGDPWTNKLVIDGDNIKIIEAEGKCDDPEHKDDLDCHDSLLDLHNPNIMGKKSIQIEPFANCELYYEEMFPGYETPFGCHHNPKKNYPFILEMNSAQGERIYNGLMLEGQSTYMLGVVWQGVIQTFRKQLGCLDEELINPTLSNDFDFPNWVWEGNTFETEFEWEDFTFETALKNADLKVTNGGIIIRAPLTVGVKGVTKPRTRFTATGPGGLIRYVLANTTGHLVRSKDNLSLLSDGNRRREAPLRASNAQEDIFASVSINIEEIFNAATYLVFKKGPLSLLDLFDIDELDPSDNWTVGLDKVVLGRFDICDIAGLLPADLPAGQLFAGVESVFDEPALHLELILDKNYPPTISLNEIDGVENATEIQLGVTNLQISVKELIPYVTEDGESIANEYFDPKDQEEILRIRLDGVIKLKAIYHQQARKFNIFIDGYENQNIHISVPEGHNAGLYDDVTIVFDLIDKLQTALSQLTKEFSSSADASATVSITLTGSAADDETGSISVINLIDAEIELNSDLAENTSCDGNIPKYHNESSNSGMTVTDLIRVPDGILQNIVDRLQDLAANNDGDDESTDILEEFPQAVDDDYFLSVCNDDQLEIDDNPIKEALCDMGIKDVAVTPSLIFDNENGYIHFSSELAIELHKWLEGD